MIHCLMHCNKCQVEPLYKVVHFNLSHELLNRISTHTCGIWYLPMFLLRDESLIFMYIDSFMILVRFWTSMPTVLKFSTVVLASPVVLLLSYIGKEDIRHSLNLSPDVLEDSPIYSSSHFYLSHLNLYIFPSLSRGAIMRFLMVFLP